MVLKLYTKSRMKMSCFLGCSTLTLWLNSTLGLIILLLQRVETEGAWIKFKKPNLLAMPVLDPSEISDMSKERLCAAYDRLACESLLPFPEMTSDHVRVKIDKVISELLNIPDISILRTMLAREPIVCLRQL